MTDLRIPKPCHENWDAMSPNERGRHCAVCDKTVVDLTRMRPSEGRRYLGELGQRLAAGAHVCVRAHADPAGRLLAPSATRRLLTNGLAAVLAVAIAGCSGAGPQVSSPSGQTQQPAQTQQQPTPMMGAPAPQPSAIVGDVATPPPPATMGEPTVKPQPPLVGRIAAPPTAAPAVKGEVECVPEMGKVVATPEPTKGKVVASPQPAPPTR